jgi:hypothetical protein
MAKEEYTGVLLIIAALLRSGKIDEFGKEKWASPESGLQT